MANVISYKGQKYVRVDSVTRKKVHRTDDMVVTMVEENYRFLKEFEKLLQEAIAVSKGKIDEYNKELRYVKKSLALLSKIKGNSDKIHALNEKGNEDFFDAISWVDDYSLKNIRDFIRKFS